MNILFATGQAYLPQMHGGIQYAAHELCTRLRQRGHRVAMLVSLRAEGGLGLVARTQAKLRSFSVGVAVARDRWPGYPVWRSWRPYDVLPYVTKHERPDVIAVLSADTVPMALAAKSTGIPFLLSLEDVWFGGHGGDISQFQGVPCITNSRFTAGAYERTFGITSTVIHPLIDPARYVTQRGGDKVVFVNPIKQKGLEIALAVARALPTIQFLFVEAWKLRPEERSQLLRSLRDLPNIRFGGPYADMRAVYSQAKVVLVPSFCDEAYGRVALEPQISGIPVIASNRGGLAEAVGSGGLLLDPDGPVQRWVDVVRSLYEDSELYGRYCAAALLHASQVQNTPEYKIGQWESLLEETRSGATQRPESGLTEAEASVKVSLP